MAQSVGQRTLVCATCRLRFRSKTHEFTGPEALDVRRVSALVVGCPEVGILGVGSERCCCVFAGASAARAQWFLQPWPCCAADRYWRHRCATPPTSIRVCFNIIDARFDASRSCNSPRTSPLAIPHTLTHHCHYTPTSPSHNSPSFHHRRGSIGSF